MNNELLIIRFTRQQARTAEQNFLPYMTLLCESKVTAAKHNSNLLSDDLFEYAAWLIYQLIVESVSDKFEKKLATRSKNMQIKFSKVESIVTYRLLMKLPIDSKQVYLINLRQWLADNIFKYLTTGEPGEPG